MAQRKIGRLIPRQFMISPEHDEWLREREYQEKRGSRSEIVREVLGRAMKDDKKRK